MRCPRGAGDDKHSPSRPTRAVFALEELHAKEDEISRTSLALTGNPLDLFNDTVSLNPPLDLFNDTVNTSGGSSNPNSARTKLCRPYSNRERQKRGDSKFP